MKIESIGTLCAMGCVGMGLAFPVKVDEFYEALHKRLTPRLSDEVDACQKIAKKTVISYQEAIDCYNSFPLNDMVRQKTLDSLNKTLELYAFKDIVTKSPEPMVPSKRDIDFEMGQISRYKFNSEFEFNAFLTGYFKSYQDGHTSYESSCYSKFIFRQPFPIYIVDNKIKTLDNLKFPKKFVENWLNLGVDIFKFQGSQILKINGRDPLNYLKVYSNFYVGKSRDINSRLSLIFARMILDKGKLGLTYGLFAYSDLVPLSSYVTYSLKTPGGNISEVKVPYLVQSPSNFQDSTSYYKNHCLPEVKVHAKPNESEQEVLFVKNTPIHQKSESLSRSKRGISKETLMETDVVGAYLIEENVGILVIPSFRFNSSGMYPDVYQALNTFKVRRVKKLILELSNNGGGQICRGYDILLGLFPNSKKALNDMRSTPLQIELRKNKSSASYSPLLYDKSLDRESHYSKEQVYSRGSKKQAKFTRKFVNYCPKAKKPFPITFNSENIAIVTNTICYSTCALLVNSLQELHNITTYAVGGDPSLPAPPSSMIGGTLMKFGELIYRLNKAKLNKHPESPALLPYHVSFRFLRIETYSHLHPDRPLEFTFLPAHYHLSYNEKSFADPVHIWSYIAKQMKTPVISKSSLGRI